MALNGFVRGWIESGRVRLEDPRPLPEDDGIDPELLAELERRARAEAPGAPPPVDPRAAAFGARALYEGCRFFAFRDLEAEAIREGLSLTCPTPVEAPSTVWSVDLCLRRLPDLWDLARGLASGDPLLEGLEALASAWPLSSVGLPVDPAPEALEPILGDAALLTIYADRVLSAGDARRAGDPRLDEALRAAVGLHPELAPAALRAVVATEARS